MSEPLLRLAGTIVAHLGRIEATDPQMHHSLAHLRESVRRARAQSYRARRHGYAPLVTSAIEAGRGGRCREILDALAPVQELLPWVYHYVPRSAAEDLGNRIAFAELVGPDGPLRTPDCRVGFTVLAERTAYPLHNHPATELYLVLAGHAQWSTTTADHVVPPGDLVLHRSNEPHAMSTVDEPLLALWGWDGDTESPAVYV